MGSKKQSSGSNKEQAEISRQQLQLEQQRLQLEQDAALQRGEELAKLQQQMDVSTQAYQSQLSFMQTQQQQALQKQDEFSKILSSLTSIMGRGEMEAEYERSRAQILGTQEGDALNARSGLLSNNAVAQTAVSSKKKQNAPTTRTQAEKRSVGLLSGEGVPR